MATYGSALWDNIPLIEQHTQEGQDFLNKLQEFMKKRAQIEVDYAKALSKLVETSKDTLIVSSISSSAAAVPPSTKPLKKQESKVNGVVATSHDSGIPTAIKAWAAIVEQTDNISKSHQSSATFIESDIIASIKNQIKSGESERKVKLNDVKTLKTEITKVYDTLAKSKKNYEATCKSADDARIAMEKASKSMTVTKGQELKLREEANVKAKKAEETDEEFQRTLADTNAKQAQHYEKDLPAALNGLQAIEEARIDFVQGVEQRYSKYWNSSFTSEVTAAFGKMVEAAGQVDHKVDSQLFITRNMSKAPLPEKIPYENVWEKLNGKKGAQNTEEVLLEQMPPEKAHKKAQQKIKELIKEIELFETKRSGIEVLAEAYLTEPQFADSKTLIDINNQLEEVESKIDTLKLQKYRYECFIATAEAKDSPALPALYADNKPGPQAQHLKQTVLGSAKGLGASGLSVSSLNSSHNAGAAAAGNQANKLPSVQEQESAAPAKKSTKATAAAATTTKVAKETKQAKEPEKAAEVKPKVQKNEAANQMAAAMKDAQIKQQAKSSNPEKQPSSSNPAVAGLQKSASKSGSQSSLNKPVGEVKKSGSKDKVAEIKKSDSKDKVTKPVDVKGSLSALNDGKHHKSSTPNDAPAKKYKAIFDFEADLENDELPFKIGEVLTVVDKDESGWWNAQNAAGKTGFIPHNYIEEI